LVFVAANYFACCFLISFILKFLQGRARKLTPVVYVILGIVLP
jgi:hypothetical protein